MNRRRRSAALVAGALLAGAALNGCAALSGADTRGVQVAAAFYPLEFVAERVAGRHADVVDLTRPGAEPHDTELTIRETAQVAQADVVVHESGFQAAVDETVAQDATGVVVDAADVGLEKDSAGRVDPHFWQDPARMADLTTRVARALVEVDPAHAAAYRTNATRLRRQLHALDAAYRDGLSGCRRDTVVVSHAAFGYLAKYGLHLEPVAGLSPDAEPTPAVLGRLHDLIRREGITTVFHESLGSPRVTEGLARDAGVTSAVLDPVEGLTDRTADEDYLSLMRQNLTALRKANGCP